jgi:hypothetical protein
MKPDTQILLHLLRAAAVDKDHAAELLVFICSSVLGDSPSCLPLNTDDLVFLACVALSAEEVQTLGLRKAFSRSFALTVFQRARGCYVGGDPEELASYDEVRFDAESWLARTDSELVAMILTHKLLNRFVGNYESFNFSLKPLSPYDWEDRTEQTPREASGQS